MRIATIDFEASCLPRHGRSYPIEVGIATDSGCSRSWLIRPHPRWRDWDWTEEAQSLHGISLDQLREGGLPARRVLTELCEAIDGCRLVADSPLDGAWLAALASAAGIVAVPAIDHVGIILDELDCRQADITHALATLERRPFWRHRAGEDARWLFSVIELLNAAAIGRAGVPACDRLLPRSSSRARPPAAMTYSVAA